MIRWLFFFAFLMLAAGSADAQQVRGIARVIDGDTLVVGKMTIRLWGIDAPEKGTGCRRGGKAWDCAGASKAALARLVEGKQVSCKARILQPDRLGRLVSVCTVGKIDVGAEMVRQGWAKAVRSQPSDYIAMGAQAARQKKGLWQADG